MSIVAVDWDGYFIYSFNSWKEAIDWLASLGPFVDVVCRIHDYDWAAIQPGQPPQDCPYCEAEQWTGVHLTVLHPSEWPDSA
jgi:hypothetical protein